MATETEQDAPFTIRSLISEAGSAGNGEKLVDAINNFYPPELQAAQERRPNIALSNDVDYDAVSTIAGITVEHVVVAGGERNSDEAWVRYVGYDENGDTIKGAFPFPDLGSKKSERHVSQRDSLSGTAAARDQRHADAKKAAAADGEDVDALKAQVAELQAQVEAGGGDTDPVDPFDGANADDVVKDLAEADRSTAEAALSYEGSQSKPRKTVVSAAEARLEVLADEDAAKEAALVEVEELRAEVERLKAEGAAS